MPTYKKLIFSDHCKDMQASRGITRQQKQAVLKDPAGEVPAKRSNRRRFWKEIDGTKLVVIVKEAKNAKKAVIITSYWWGN